MSAKSASETPLMKQYAQIKARYPGALLLFRVGDFYETFGEDAVQCSKVLGITLTKRANGAASETALAGFPHHSLDQYLPRLVRSGLRVAVCDQTEDPKAAKGIVKREVTELVSPAVAFSDSLLDHSRNNYLAAVYIAAGGLVGLAFCDASTGSFQATQVDPDQAIGLLQRYAPREVLGSKQGKTALKAQFGEAWAWQWLEDWVWESDSARQRIERQFQSRSIKGFGLEGMDAALMAAGAVLHYLNETRRDGPLPLVGLSRLDPGESLWMDPFTLKTLELLEPQQSGGMSLATCLDDAVTPMGQRLLRRWLAFPLRSLEAIEERLRVVDYLVAHPVICEELRRVLEGVGDLERMAARVGVLRCGPREMVQVARSLEAASAICDLLKSGDASAPWQPWLQGMDLCEDLKDRIHNTLSDNAPALLSKGGVIREGYHPELDELRSLKEDAKGTMQQMVQDEIQRTRIPSLKINYNQVFGFYLEVTHAHKDKVPLNWIRKQTLVNAERYITPELKAFEERYLTADHRMQELESSLYIELQHQASKEVPRLQQTASLLASLDVLLGFGNLALQRDYHRPQLRPHAGIRVQALRHPVLERLLPASQPYVPNDLDLHPEKEQIWMITGPNMAGKSALLRQTGLMVVMAQVGCYVAAQSAEIGLVDKLFTRVGASDNLAAGESTFMVEMQEMATILHHMTGESLLLLDEIGRGTSTYDGISLAWGVAAYLHEHPRLRPQTLFATHYHELNRMASLYPRMANYHVSVAGEGDHLQFLRILRPGGSSHSFGLHVARMAGVPPAVLDMARTVLAGLEAGRDIPGSDPDTPSAGSRSTRPLQLQLFEPGDPAERNLANALRQLNINDLTPLEALHWLAEQQTRLGRKSQA
jgi:DNA mismatch repair protein MutS